jgi:hypothetical protein
MITKLGRLCVNEALLGWELWRIVRYLGGEFFDVPDDF